MPGVVCIEIDMQKVSDYKIITSGSADEVQKSVTTDLKNGYELYGPPFAGNNWIGQAIVKYERSPHHYGRELPSTLA
ncbi:MAG TPA: DUF1737 domain-containing protein [Terrimicrobium sp.]